MNEPLETRLGKGTVKKIKDSYYFQGKMPIDSLDGSEVIVMLKSDYESIKNGNLAPLFKYNQPMTDKFREHFADYLTYVPQGEEPTTLNLERYLMTNDPSKSIIVVYKSVSESLEEGEEP